MGQEKWCRTDDPQAGCRHRRSIVDEGSFIYSEQSRKLKHRGGRNRKVVQLQNLPRVSYVHNLREFRKKITKTKTKNQ